MSALVLWLSVPLRTQRLCFLRFCTFCFHSGFGKSVCWEKLPRHHNRVENLFSVGFFLFFFSYCNHSKNSQEQWMQHLWGHPCSIWHRVFCKGSLGFCGLQDRTSMDCLYGMLDWIRIYGVWKLGDCLDRFVMFVGAFLSFCCMGAVYWPATEDFCCHGVVWLAVTMLTWMMQYKNVIHMNASTHDFPSRTLHCNKMIYISHLSVLSLLLLISAEKHEELIYN